MKNILGFLKNLPELELDAEKKKILALYALGFLVIFVLYFVLLLKPALGALATLIPETRTLKANIKAVNDDLNFEDKLKNKFESVQEKLKEYGNKLSRERELPKLLENLSDTAKSSRVKIVSIAPQTKKDTDEDDGICQEMPIAITGHSSYHDLGSFINKLENDERYMQISDIKIKANPSNPKRHDIEFVVSAYTFKGE